MPFSMQHAGMVGSEAVDECVSERSVRMHGQCLLPQWGQGATRPEEASTATCDVVDFGELRFILGFDMVI